MSHEYIEYLREHYRINGIGRKQFVDKTGNACSHCDDLTNGELLKGADTYIGSKYGSPFKIVVVCLDPGKDSKSFDERRIQIEGSTPDNPHMRGTQNTLEALLVNEEIEKEQLFSHYAMVNSCKCFPNDGTMNKAPDKFFENCRVFINEEIRLLEPDIIITQGNQAINAVAAYMPKRKKKTFYHNIANEMMEKYPGYFPTSYFDYLIEKYFRYVEIDNCLVPTICPPHPSDRYGKWAIFQEAYLNVSMELARRAIKKIKE